MPSDTVDYEALDTVLDDLDVKSQDNPTHEEEDDAYWVCQRRHPRHPFRVSCTIHFFAGGGSTVSAMPGRTRNLSRNGVALLVRRVFAKNEPIEIEINVPGRPRTYMAGLVTFCRYAGQGYHELGVELKIALPEPVFSREPLLAMRTLDWLNPQPQAEENKSHNRA